LAQKLAAAALPNVPLPDSTAETNPPADLSIAGPLNLTTQMQQLSLTRSLF
jgi:hypothetical protein